MLRIVVVVAMLGLCQFCAAQEKPEKFTPVVGDRFVAIKHITAATESIYLSDLGKAFSAKDREGLDKMEEDGQVVTVKPDQHLTVLEVMTKGPVVPADCLECRLIVDGKAVRKVYVFSLFCNDKSMKREPAKP